MNIKVDTHTHTLASGHAYSTIREMAKAAKEKGLEGLAITDHAPTMPGGPHLFYFQNTKVLPKQMEGVEMLYGVELNILNEEGDIDLPIDVLDKLDLKIASIHPPCFQGEITKESITRTYLNVMDNKRIDIIGHPDDARFPIDYEKLVKKAKETHTLLEINNSSLHPQSFRQGARKNITTLLKECQKQQVPVVIGTDSHVDIDVGICDYVSAVMSEVGFPQELVVNTKLTKLKAALQSKSSRL